MRRTVKYSIFAVLLFVSLLAVGGVTLLNMDVNRLKPEIQAFFKEATGRELTLGKITPSLGLTPSFTVHDITIENMPGGSQALMAKAGTLHITLALLPLLHKQLHIKNIEIQDASLVLEENAKGKNNWTLPASDDASSALFQTEITKISFKNTMVTYLKNKKENVQASIENLFLKKDDTSIKFSFVGIYDHLPMIVEGKVLHTDTLPEGKAAVDLNLTTKDSSVALKATVKQLFSRPVIKGTLTGRNITIDNFIMAPAVTTVDDNKLFPATPLELGGLKTLDAELDVTLDNLHYGRMHFTNLQSHLILKSGTLSINPFSALLMGSPLSGMATLDASRSVPSLAVSLSGEHLPAEKLLKNLNITDKLNGGKVSFKSETVSYGNALDVLAANLDGNVHLYLENAQYKSNADLGSAEGFFTLLTGKKNRNKTNINCAAAVFDVEKGIAHSRAIVLDATGALVKGKGKINLADETLAILLTPRAKTVGVADLVTPMWLKGPFDNPLFVRDKKSILKTVGKAALGVATGGTATLGFAALDMVKKLGIKTKGNVCLAAMSMPSK